MAKDRSGKHGNNDKPQPSQANDADPDRQLWQRVASTVAPISSKSANRFTPETDKPPKARQQALASEQPHQPGTDLTPLKNLKSGLLGSGSRDVAQQPSPAVQRAMPVWDVEGADTPDVDRRTAQKLRRGQLPIDARIDLHGDRQHQAQQRLTRFILASHSAGHRCVLVITGKGTRHRRQPDVAMTGDVNDPQPGVIRRRLLDWLSAPALRPLILAVKTARPGDGGRGAFYVLLRRNR
ncbi:MAG TPA: hypothetical protein DFI00_06760 [Rhodospirillaceae bacterium]|nr:hypothetical protein [Alphaproteobacteria bacterium]OUT41084.1 MAG: hypothetical protein CBB62_01615 [Micavibrio sp. TMED2]HCI46975.1 hypothetical protein [Rhodospirillaceae bacterium]MAS47411.1 hypothetical protein [Alphaproteobacteria bacterium]MAX96716.1 hypothetical protein [Alphaproteobacteria bacterium]|tara:strand:+ start:21500 stop:22213 length:714 start_codon:yes stop_codon:yes gene_type:complete